MNSPQDTKQFIVNISRYFSVYSDSSGFSHTTFFQRCNDVVDVQTTLLQRQNDVVCLLGGYKSARRKVQSIVAVFVYDVEFREILKNRMFMG